MEKMTIEKAREITEQVKQSNYITTTYIILHAFGFIEGYESRDDVDKLIKVLQKHYEYMGSHGDHSDLFYETEEVLEEVLEEREKNK